MTRRLILQILASAFSSSGVGCAARPRIACVGDSITSGTGLQRPDAESYPAQLQKMLPRISVHNLGVPGATVSRDGGQPFGKSGKLEELSALRPEVVVLLIGTNDSKPQSWSSASAFEACLHALATELIARTPTHRIVVASPPPAWENTYKISAVIVEEEIVPAVARVAQTVGAPYVDVWALFRQRKDRFPDGVHPDALGAAEIAAALRRPVADSLPAGALRVPPDGRTI